MNYSLISVASYVARGTARAICLAITLSMACACVAQDDTESAEAGQATETAATFAAPTGEYKVEEILAGLNNPCGIAIQPQTNALFIAESGGQRIVRLEKDALESQPVITDFPKDQYGSEYKINIGPLSLLFLDERTLIVGGGGQADGSELLRIYQLPEDKKPIKADQMVASFDLPASSDTPGEGNFFALAANPIAIYVTSNGDDSKGWIAKATIDAGVVTSFERYLATKEATKVDAPVGATISPHGYLVVGQMGEITDAQDSLISFYDVNSGGKLLLNLETGLHDICAVAYSKRGQMYALDYSWADASQGGLFQIIKAPDSKTGMRSERIVSLNKPTAMAFDANGDLFVTTLENINDDGNGIGRLLKISSTSGL